MSGARSAPAAGFYAPRVHRRRIRVVVMCVLAAAALEGCGGAKHASSSSSAAGKGSSSTGSASTTAGGPSSSATTTGLTTTGPASRRGASDVRIPASFTIGHGGTLTPPTVSAPAFLAVQLTVASGDGRGHTVLLETPRRKALRVPPGGRASALVAGLRAGRYPIEVDGAPRGALMIGGEPGP